MKYDRSVMALVISLAAATSLVRAERFSELVVFGDSFTDTGNYYSRWPNDFPSPPYFNGRFSNGRVWVERLAEQLGAPAPIASERGGTNYAWGGARTGAVPNQLGVPDMDSQVQDFLTSNTLDSNQLFVFWGGDNDVGRTDPSDSVQSLSVQISSLAEAGAEDFLVLNVNTFARSGLVPQFNTLLSEELASIRQANASLSIFELDYASLELAMIADPESFGLTNVTDQACQNCTGPSPEIVPNPDEYRRWDEWHLTARTNQIIADAAFAALPFVRSALVPGQIYDVYDDDRDLLFDDMGDAADSALTRQVRSVGEKDLDTVNRVSRLVTKFDLPEPSPDQPVLDSATLRFYLDGVVGSPAGPVSLFHSRTDNDMDVLATDYEDTGYIDTLLDLIQPTDQAGQYYEVNVTDQVLADYTLDDNTLLSAFRLQVSETAFAEDDEGHLYKLTMPGSDTNRPHLALTFTTGPSQLGDVNLDGEVNGLDVDPFVEVLLSGPYQQEADMNDDQVVNGLDVDPFVAAVVGGGTQQIPEPSTLLLVLIALGVVGGWRKWGG